MPGSYVVQAQVSQQGCNNKTALQTEGVSTNNVANDRCLRNEPLLSAMSSRWTLAGRCVGEIGTQPCHPVLVTQGTKRMPATMQTLKEGVFEIQRCS